MLGYSDGFVDAMRESMPMLLWMMERVHVSAVEGVAKATKHGQNVSLHLFRLSAISSVPNLL